MTPQDDLYKELARRLPGWATRGTSTRLNDPLPFLGPPFLDVSWFLLEASPELGEEIPKDPVWGAITAQFADLALWLAQLMQQTRIGTATAEWLDLHARERGIPRHDQEDDARLRARLRQIPDAVVEKAIKAAIDHQLAEGESEVFTLRYRQLFWGRHFWGTSRRWGVTVIPYPVRVIHRSMFWGTGHWNRDCWSAYSLIRGPRHRPSPWLVALAIVPAQQRGLRYYWRRNLYWSRGPWGAAQPDTARYAAIRKAAEQTRAAGITVWIWID